MKAKAATSFKQHPEAEKVIRVEGLALVNFISILLSPWSTVALYYLVERSLISFIELTKEECFMPKTLKNLFARTTERKNRRSGTLKDDLNSRLLWNSVLKGQQK